VAWPATRKGQRDFLVSGSGPGHGGHRHGGRATDDELGAAPIAGAARRECQIPFIDTDGAVADRTPGDADPIAVAVFDDELN